MEKFGREFDWQRQFFVTDHVRHKNGFTLYKITSIVFPRRNPEAGTKIVVWKRFNEFKKLYYELRRKHCSLRIDEDYPSLIKSNFFTRFSEDVIQERKKFISKFLSFVGKYPSLFTTNVFVKFFHDGYNISEYDDKKIDNDDASTDIDFETEIRSRLHIFSLFNMGQVMNSEGSQSSDESHDDSTLKKTRLRKSNINFRESSHSFTMKKSAENSQPSSVSRIISSDMPEYWEEAVAHANEAHHQEIIGNYEVAFAMYKTAIVCLLSGVQGDNDVDHRMKVKELSSQYLLQAEWIYNNYLALEDRSLTVKHLKIPWRSRSQLKRYKVINILSNNLLVHDNVDNDFVVVKGVLKSSSPLDRNGICVLPKDVPFMVSLLALHETETTIFFILEYVRYGKLWDHLEIYFTSSYVLENLDTDVTCFSPQDKDEESGFDPNSLASSGSSTNDQDLSRLESSTFTDTVSCESLSSHDENYFDLIEDYARAKSQKLKEIQNFNERRKHVESLRPVKKTISQVDLKSLDDNYEQHRSHSLTDLARDDEYDGCANGALMYQSVNDGSITDDFRFTPSDDDEKEKDFPPLDIDTQQLLRNAQRLIESINETLSKNENLAKDENGSGGDQTTEEVTAIDAPADEIPVSKRDDLVADEFRDKAVLNLKLKEPNLCSPISPISVSVPSITEEYSITAALQRNGITGDIIKRWAVEILVAVDSLHRNGVICRDLNPNNILLADNGSIKLTYFFRYPNIDPSVNSYAKERLYMAPEVDNTNINVTFASDWWSFGAILYELITLQSLKENHPEGVNSHTIINVPEKIQSDSKSLLLNLLRFDPSERLGSGISGVEDIKSHPYFSGVKWEEIF